MQGKLQEQRNLIVSNMVKHITFEGWTDLALKLSMEELKIDYHLKNLYFPKGFIDIFFVLMEITDESALSNIDYNLISNLKVREKIFYLVKLKIEAMDQYKDAVKTGISLIISSPNTKIFKLFWNSMDEIWKIAGDKSLDYNYYTKRVLLSKLYIKTLLFWFEDNSENCNKTWEYLRKQIDGIIKFGNNINKLKDIPSKITKMPFIRLLFLR